MNDFFTVNELAQFFNVNPKTIYRSLWAKAIPVYMVGRTWRIAKKDINWLGRYYFKKVRSNQFERKSMTK